MSVFTDRYDAIYNAVVTLTNRPDMPAETALGVSNATLTIHLADHFPRDIVSTDVPSATPAYTQSIDTQTYFPRFRDVAAVALLDVDGNQIPSPEIEVVEFGDFWVPGYPGVPKQNICWLAGTNLNVRSAVNAYGTTVDWFQSPTLLRDTYNSWIADVFPDPLIWYAAMVVWNRSGNENKAQETFRMLYGTPGNDYTALIPTLKRNFSTLAGR